MVIPAILSDSERFYKLIAWQYLCKSSRRNVLPDSLSEGLNDVIKVKYRL